MSDARKNESPTVDMVQPARVDPFAEGAKIRDRIKKATKNLPKSKTQ